jgi:hypothetical protein
MVTSCVKARASSTRNIATSLSISLVWTFRSSSFLTRRFRESQPKVRSTIHRRGSLLKPRTPGSRFAVTFAVICAFRHT